MTIDGDRKWGLSTVECPTDVTAYQVVAQQLSSSLLQILNYCMSIILVIVYLHSMTVQ